MTTLTEPTAALIASLLVANGYSTCTPEDVFDVHRYGSVEPSTMSDEYDEKLADQILDQLDSRGIEPPT